MRHAPSRQQIPAESRLTLARRLSLVFSVLLLACCGAFAWLQVRSFHSHEQEVVQSLSRDLAAHIAQNPDLAAPAALDPEVAHHLFEMLMAVNPSVEVYLLGPDGVIRAHAAPPGRLRMGRVDLAPVRRLLAGDALPILGDDPRGAPASKVFSAAPLGWNGQLAGYVYIVLMGEERDRLAADLESSAVLRAGLGALALVALVGLVVGWITFYFTTRRLRVLSNMVRRVEDEGVQVLEPLAVPPGPAPAGGDEIVVLETGFRRMAARISDQWRALVEQDQQRRELVANISHDLRTPLTALHGYLETLAVKGEHLAEADRRRYLETALAQSRLVGRLAAELFELARLEYGVVQPELEVFSVADLVQDVFQKFELSAEARDIRLRADVAPDLPTVNADLGMMERVLTNLLDNALRHTPEGGEILVRLSDSGAGVAVEVADTGPGVPAHLREGLFTRPSVMTGGASPQRGGLGLLIVQRILRLHGSDIRLQEWPGRGAVFVFGLPGGSPG